MPEEIYQPPVSFRGRAVRRRTGAALAFLSFAGASLAAAVALGFRRATSGLPTVNSRPEASAPEPSLEPSRPVAEPDPLDIEAAARMIASENPSADERVKIEQIWAELRSRGKGESLYHRITGGNGWGPQVRKLRPVATTKPARPADIELARGVLRGELPSTLPGARKYFDPEQEDRIYQQVTKARAELAAGRPISKRSQELIDAGYHRTAQDVRDKWTREGTRFVGTVGPVEFWT